MRCVGIKHKLEKIFKPPKKKKKHIRTELEDCQAPGGSAKEQDGGGGSERAQCDYTECDSATGPAAGTGRNRRRPTTVCSLAHLRGGDVRRSTTGRATGPGSQRPTLLWQPGPKENPEQLSLHPLLVIKTT